MTASAPHSRLLLKRCLRSTPPETHLPFRYSAAALQSVPPPCRTGVASIGGAAAGGDRPSLEHRPSVMDGGLYGATADTETPGEEQRPQLAGGGGSQGRRKRPLLARFNLFSGTSNGLDSGDFPSSICILENSLVSLPSSRDIFTGHIQVKTSLVVIWSHP